MKKLLFPLLALILVFSCTCNLCAAPSADVNGDGSITVADALLGMRALVNNTFETIPDLNSDGRASLADVLHILRLCIGELDAFYAFGGTGSAEDPYIVDSESDLARISAEVLRYTETAGLYFKQTKDIRLTAKNWEPIGTTGIPFAGHYDGNGHKIEGLSIETDRSFQGLFGFLTGSVQNLTVYGDIAVHYTGVYAHSYAGGIVGAMNNGALVKNCKSHVRIEGDAYVGGVVGAIVYTDDYLTEAFSSIEDCVFYGKLTADDRAAIHEDGEYFGGIVGKACGAVKNCKNYGDVTVTGEKNKYVGGVAGFAYSPYKTYAPSAEVLPLVMMENCENHGKVHGDSHVGGVVGQSSLPVKSCQNHGAVEGTIYVGGIIGVNGTDATYAEGYTFVADCKNTATVTVSQLSGGGIAGYSFLTVMNCENAGKVCGADTSERMGGIVGYSRSNVHACKNLATATVGGGQALGGIVGYFNQSKAAVTDCTNLADVTANVANEAAYHVGGIVGMLGSTNSVLRSVNEGDITGGGTASYTGGTGGIVGSLYSGSIMEDCVNKGDVCGTIRVGGLAGHGKMSKTSYIRKSENYGDVTATAESGSAHLGGILGSATSGNVADCTNHGKVTAATGVTDVSDTVGSTANGTTVTNVK